MTPARHDLVCGVGHRAHARWVRAGEVYSNITIQLAAYLAYYFAPEVFRCGAVRPDVCGMNGFIGCGAVAFLVGVPGRRCRGAADVERPLGGVRVFASRRDGPRALSSVGARHARSIKHGHPSAAPTYEE